MQNKVLRVKSISKSFSNVKAVSNISFSVEQGDIPGRFIYHTLLKEPILLNLVELTILLIGSFLEGLIISIFFLKNQVTQKKQLLLKCIGYNIEINSYKR